MRHRMAVRDGGGRMPFGRSAAQAEGLCHQIRARRFGGAGDGLRLVERAGARGQGAAVAAERRLVEPAVDGARMVGGV
jgi:hypothetical protein